jgi:hypothetical protein
MRISPNEFYFEVQMNQLIHISVRQESLVIVVTKQDVVANDWPMSCGSYDIFGWTKAADILLDLKLLQRRSGIAAIYSEMASTVRDVSGWGPLPLTKDSESSAFLL